MVDMIMFRMAFGISFGLVSSLVSIAACILFFPQSIIAPLVVSYFLSIISFYIGDRVGIVYWSKYSE